jgi:hypothetical protein
MNRVVGQMNVNVITAFDDLEWSSTLSTIWNTAHNRQLVT